MHDWRGSQALYPLRHVPFSNGPSRQPLLIYSAYATHLFFQVSSQRIFLTGCSFNLTLFLSTGVLSWVIYCWLCMTWLFHRQWSPEWPSEEQTTSPANPRRWPNAVSMLVHRVLRWPSNNPTQFADGSIREPPGQWPSILLSVDPLLFNCWPSVFDAGPTVEQQWACNSLQRWYNIKPAVGEHPGLQVITNAVLRVGRDWIIAALVERRVRILRSSTGHDQLLMRWPN